MNPKLTKRDFSLLVSDRLQLPIETADAAINLVFSQIRETLNRHGEATLDGFGGPIVIKKIAKQPSTPRAASKPLPSQEPAEIMRASKPGHEQRKLQRRNFIIDLEVLDTKTGEIIGDMGDITTEGLMLVSETPIPEDTLYTLVLALPEEVEEEMEIRFTARSIRCQKTVHESIYTTGFKIEEIDLQNRENIETLISQFAI